jgi:soluble lytic murein transglycosylase-like protein
MAKPPEKKKAVTPQQARQILETQRQRIRDRFKDNPAKLEVALATFESDPRIQNARKIAGYAPVTTRQQEIRRKAQSVARITKSTGEIKKLAEQVDVAKRKATARTETARRVIERQKAENKDSIIPEFVRDTGAGMLSGANNALFGLPARAAAAITGTDNRLMQEYIDQQGQRAPVTNFLTTLAASVPTGGALFKGGAALGTRLAASGSRPAAATGQALQAAGRAATLKKGENVKNAGRLAATGAGFGAVDAAVRDRDVKQGAAYGAVGSVALGAGAKGAMWLGSKASDALRVSGADSLLRRYTKTTAEELQRRLDDFKARGKAQPTLYELLDLEGRQALSNVLTKMKPNTQERGANLARERVESVPRDLARTVKQATRKQRRSNVEKLMAAQTDARSSVWPTTAEARLAVGAADNPTRLAQLRREEAAKIMSPFDGKRAADNVDSLIPTTLQQGNKPGEVVEVPTDPEMAAMIRSAAGLARIRDKEQGLTVRELTGMISKLKEIATGGDDPIQRGNAQRAVDHLEDQLSLNVPGVRTALTKMNEAWAARSRQLEGMRETRPQAAVDPSTSQRLRKSENVFETPEGAVGRQAGQRTELLDDLGRRPDAALGTVRNLAEDETLGRQLAQNLGRPVTDEITQTAQAQVESVRRLATAVRDPKFDTSELQSGDLALLAGALNPASMAYTKARGLAILTERLAQMMPESSRRAVIVDMLFSRDPAMTQRAINALRGQGRAGDDALRGIVTAMAGAAEGVEAMDEPVATLAPLQEIPAEEAQPMEETDDLDLSRLSDDELLEMYQAGEDVDITQLSDDELMQMYEGGAEKASPYTNDLEALYANEDPALIDLIERVSKQESGGKQFDRSGRPVTSKAGAIGVMQVMPGTGPEAAKLAGVPWDEQAYRNDEAYNKLIGTAYLSEMLRRYDGDVELALVAYNAGPKRADAYASGKIKFLGLPAETQEYVRKIM